MIAASRGDLAEVRRLIDKGEEINTADIYGNTALSYAASGGHADIVEILLQSGADIRVKNKLGRDCLASAESRGHEKVVSILRGAKLLLSIREGETARIIELLNLGVDVNLQLTDGWTPLMVAALDNQLEVANILLSRGADTALQNAKGLTAEMIAERKGHSRVVECLVAARRSVNRPVIQAPEVESDILDLAEAPLVATSGDESEVVN